LTYKAPVIIVNGFVARLGDFLRGLRETQGWSLREAAEHSGLSNGYISLLENGRIENPSATVLGRLAQAYETPINRVLVAAGVPTDQPTSQSLDPRLVELLERLTPEAQAEVASYAGYLARLPAPVRNRRRPR
jgi:HTH-type transcriptional regulator, competence development regulator